MKRVLLAIVAAAAIALSGASTTLATRPTSPPGQGECDRGNSTATCRPDPQPEHGQDCDEHGPHEGGVNEDHCASPTPTPRPSVTPTPTRSPIPSVTPSSHPSTAPSPSITASPSSEATAAPSFLPTLPPTSTVSAEDTRGEDAFWALLIIGFGMMGYLITRTLIESKEQ